MKLHSLTVRGYKSIRQIEKFEFRDINVLIGANGAGKSNLISLFRMFAALSQSKLQNFLQTQGGIDALLFGGRKRTEQIDLELSFGQNQYQASLEPTVDNRLIFTEEEVGFQGNGYNAPYLENLGNSHNETKLIGRSGVSAHVMEAMKSWRVYHFHDTSDSAAIKGLRPSNNNLRLLPDAENLAAYVSRLKVVENRAYERIVSTIRLAAPFFGDFVIRNPLPAMVEMEWTERGDEFETPHRAHTLSDGTIRFICLATLLLQPSYLLPDTIIIDEPELGLHPYAINLLAEMLKQVASTKQVIVATQSVELLNHFAPEDVIVVDREEGASVFQRLERDALAGWLEDYTMGELWQSNLLGARPTFAGGRV